MKRHFLTGLKALAVSALAFAAVSCYDDSELWGELEGLEQRVAALEEKLNSEVKAINTTLGALKSADEKLTADIAAVVADVKKANEIISKLDAADGTINGRIDDLEKALSTFKSDAEKKIAEVLAQVAVVKVEKNAAGNYILTFADGNTLEVSAPDSNSNNTGVVTTVEVEGVTYWAVIGADGKTTVLDAIVHPDTKLEFKVDPKTYEVFVTYNGKDWEATGVVVKDAETINIVTGFEDTKDYVVLTVGGVEYKLPKVSTNRFDIVSGKVFFQPESTKSIPVRLDGMVTSMVAKQPKGWDVTLSAGGGLSVTSPAVETVMGEDRWGDPIEMTVAVNGGDMGGIIEIWVVLEDGRTVIGNASVGIATAPAEITFDKDGNVTYTFPVSDTGYGYDAPEFVLFGAYNANNMTDEEVFENILTFAMEYEAPGVYSNFGDDEFVTVPVVDLLGETPEVGSTYIFWAIHKPNMSGMNPDGTYVWDVTMSDIQKVYYTPTEVNVEFNPGVFNLSADVSVTGADAFYALACQKFAWEQTLESLKEEYITFDQLFAGVDNVQLVRIDSNNATVDYTTWGIPESYIQQGYLADVYPETEYVLGIIPAIDSKVIADYTIDDLQIFDIETLSMQVGGKATVEMSASEVKYTNVNVDVVVEGAVRSFYKYFTPEEVEAIGVDNLEDYTLENFGEYTPNKEASYTIYGNQQFNSGTTYTFVVLAVDENGGYTFTTLSQATKTINYAADGTITVSPVSVDMTKSSSPVVTFEVTGATKLIVGEKPRTSNEMTDSYFSKTAANILGIYPTKWAAYTYVDVIDGKVSVALSNYSYYNFVITALTGSTADDVQLMHPFWLTPEMIQQLPATPAAQ